MIDKLISVILYKSFVLLKIFLIIIKDDITTNNNINNSLISIN